MQDNYMLPLELCWLQGFNACQTGLEEAENPYPPHTKAAHYWQEGWWEHYFNEGELAV